MAHHGIALSISLIFSIIHITFGAPGSTVNNFNNAGGNFELGSADEAQNDAFQVYSNMEMNGKVCSQQVTVSGRGVFDTFDLKCQTMFSGASLGTEKFALYRNPQAPLTFFTNTPNTLIIVEDGKCTKRTYKTTSGKTTYSTSYMTRNECMKATKDMEEAEKEWEREFEEKMRKAFPPCFPFCNSHNDDDDNNDSQPHPEKPNKNQHDSDEDDDDDDDDDDWDSDEDDAEEWNF